MTFVTVVVTESGDATARHSRSPRKALPPPPTISRPTNTALVGVIKEEEKDGATALMYDLVDGLMVVTTERAGRKDVNNTCAGGWWRWLSSSFPWWLNDIVWGIIK
jgi:hypothetical protein